MESAKECVTTHGPNVLALKIDCAQTDGPKRYRTNFVRFCRGVYLLLGRLTVKLVRATGSADLGRSSSVLVLSLKTDVDEVFIDTLYGYELVDLNALFADKEQGYYSLASLFTSVVTFLSFIFLRVAWRVRYLCILTGG